MSAPWRRGKWAIILTGLALAACLPEYQPKQAGDDDFVLRRDSPKAVGDSVEWLYVADESTPPEKQCGVTLKAVQGEESCRGPLCVHAVRLSQDWLRGCSKHLPDGVPQVKGIVKKIGEQPSVGIRPCDQEGSALLEKGCKTEEGCQEQIQKWVTRCGGEVGSPLVARMIQVSAAQKLGKARLRVDSRSCDALAEPVRKGANCSLGTPCAKPLDAADLLRKRCTDVGIPVSVSDAVAIQSITAGAGQFGGPVPVKGEPKSITDRDAKLPLSDGSGAILMLCDRRTLSVSQYLDVRRSCTEGDMLLAILDRGSEPPTVRMAKLDYFGDDDMLSRAPSLKVDGEAPIRERKTESALRRELTEAGTLGKRDVKAGLVKLIEVLTKYRRVIRNSESGSSALQSRDRLLVTLFLELGKLKSKKATARLSGNRFVTYIRRSTVLALSDVTPEGEVEIRASNPASSFDLRAHLPKAMAAYTDALEAKIKAADKKRYPASVVSVFLGKAADHATTCADAQTSLLKSENMEILCAARMEKCADSEILRDSAREKAQTDAEAAYTKIWMNLASVPEDQRKTALKAAANAGCRAPWW